MLTRVLEARQLALKLLANVTYGYTSASFSGRMPMGELADAIVQCGRSTLLWTIGTIESNPQWQARVVYGDTDSVFVLLKGRTMKEAFDVGAAIASRITELSPAAVVLKLEKVYSRCFLVSKKRYVGYSYESPNQMTATYDAKGIETQRRDNCSVTQKLQEKSIRLYFQSGNIDQVREYLSNQWVKIHSGVGMKLTLQDFIFNKAVKWGKYKSESSCPPGAIVCYKKIHEGDERAKPPYGWRVPYVVVWGKPGSILRDLVAPPEAVLARGSNLNINHTYYITKVINPAIDRIFRLCGVNIDEWYFDTPRPKQRLRLFQYREIDTQKPHRGMGGGPRQLSIASFVKSTICEGCGADSSSYLCGRCAHDGEVDLSLTLTLNRLVQKEHTLSMICQNCCKFSQRAVFGELARGLMVSEEGCSSLSCQIFFERCRLILRIEDISAASSEVKAVLDDSDIIGNMKIDW